MEKVLKDKVAICIFVLPALIIFTAVVIVTILYSGYYSFFQWDGIGEKTLVGFKNYIMLFNGDDGFLKAVGNTLLLSLLSILIQLPIALLLALILASGVKAESFLRSALFVPVILSSVVIGALWKQIYHPTLGLINTTLNSLGLHGLTRTWLGDSDTALIACFIPIVWQWIGYHMLIMYASIKSIPKDIGEAAMIDGASGFKKAGAITIPLIKPVLKICLIFAVIGSLQAFDLVYVLTNGGPAHASEVPSTLMINTIFQKYMYGYGSAMAIFIVIESLIFTLLIQKLFKPEEITY